MLSNCCIRPLTKSRSDYTNSSSPVFSHVYTTAKNCRHGLGLNHFTWTHQEISFNSSHLVLCLSDRSSCLIFQFLFMPEEQNLTTSSRMLKFTLSTALIKYRLTPFDSPEKKFPWIAVSGTIPLSITPAFL